ncbi:hepatic and glial cell adhesion molecule a [Chiloscyllium plagiosum]|uniref:hepatic and glial cell adhesion molecule a n=1 Tax=Chiloscyllium plagiosum TaxID=36176 RepID=UPI001CB8708C|nr:hepatic and glial cell adhesion molecule a [Chiloscyllium plagiosum]
MWVQDFPYLKLTMNCSFENGSNPQLSWMEDNASLLFEPRFQLSADLRSLVVINLTSSDCGVYICTIQNHVNRVQTQQLIAGDQFQACLQLLSQGKYLAVVLCILLVFSSIVTIIVIKLHRKRQRGDVLNAPAKNAKGSTETTGRGEVSVPGRPQESTAWIGEEGGSPTHFSLSRTVRVLGTL